MNALLWKKLHELKNNKAKIIILLLLPVLYIILLLKLKIDVNLITAYYTLAITLPCSGFLFESLDVLSSEVLLASDISIKQIWRFNVYFSVITNFLYSLIVLISAILLLKINIGLYSIFQNISNVVISISLVSGSILYFCDYTKIKKTVGLIFGLPNLFFPILLAKYGNSITVNTKNTLVYTTISLIIYLLFELIVKLSANNEKVLINIRNTITNLKNKLSLDD